MTVGPCPRRGRSVEEKEGVVGEMCWLGMGFPPARTCVGWWAVAALRLEGLKVGNLHFDVRSGEKKRSRMCRYWLMFQLSSFLPLQGMVGCEKRHPYSRPKRKTARAVMEWGKPCLKAPTLNMHISRSFGTLQSSIRNGGQTIRTPYPSNGGRSLLRRRSDRWYGNGGPETRPGRGLCPVDRAR